MTTTITPIAPAEPTTVAPSTVAPSTVAPSTVAPSTVAPSTVAPSTVAPSTVAPSTVAPSTVAPSTVAPSTAATYGLSAEDLDELGRRLDAIRQTVTDDLGQADVDYIRRVILWQRALEVAGRGLLYFGWFPPAWLVATGALGVSKILDNMEIGHNVMHGQYDWTNDPALSSQVFDWETACPAESWRHSHNYLHHTYTNILDKDRDIGYGVLRMSEGQPWSVKSLANPVIATLLALNFDLGVMFHDVEVERVVAGQKTWEEAWPTLRAGLAKTGRLAAKDYVIWPALTGPLFVSTLGANFTANVIRNVWSFTIIFCGHFPAGTHEFTEEECAGESRGHWYFRQMLGSANIEGSRLFHIMSGNLSHQIEHHLFPDIPARRYKEISGEVRVVCERFGLPYNSGGLTRQFSSVVRKIVRLSLPGRGAKPAPATDTVEVPMAAAA